MKRAPRQRRWWVDGQVVIVAALLDGPHVSEWRPPAPWPLSLALNPVDGPRWHMRAHSTHLPWRLDYYELGDRAKLFMERQNGEIPDITWRVRRRFLVESGQLAP